MGTEDDGDEAEAQQMLRQNEGIYQTFTQLKADQPFIFMILYSSSYYYSVLIFIRFCDELLQWGEKQGNVYYATVKTDVTLYLMQSLERTPTVG